MGITTRLRWASVGVAVAGALLTVPGAAQAAGAAHGGGGGEAYGSATNGLFTLRFHVYEHGADPHNVSGWVEVQPNAAGPAGSGPSGPPASSAWPAGRLTCVDIEGNKVGAVYVPDPASVPPAFRGQALFATGVDSGPGGQDKMGFVAGPPSRFPTCRPTFAVPNTQVIQGDLTVRPAS